MSNIRKLQYDAKTGKCGISVKGKTHWFDKNDAFVSDNPNLYGIKVNSRNFFFPINENLQSGVTSPYWSIQDNKVSRTIPPLTFPRVRADIGLWRAAILEMENKPWNWRVKNALIAQDTILDAHVKSCWNKRKRLTLLKKPVFFDKQGNPIENNKNLDFINSQWFYQLIDFILDAQGYGYQLVELGELRNNGFPDIGIVPRQNISPDREVVAQVVYNVNGVLFNINPETKVNVGGKEVPASPKSPNGEYYYNWNVWIKTPNEFGSHTSTCGYGLFYWVSLYALLIRNNLQNNANFNETYIKPIRWLQTMKTDPKERQQVFDELVKMGDAGVILSDPNDKFELVQNASIGTAYNTYADMEQRLKKSISALILGHEDAMHSIPGKMGGEQSGGGSKQTNNTPIQEAIEETEAEQDRWLCSHINDQVIPKLRNIGFEIPFDVTYGYTNDREENEQQERQNKYNIDFATVVKTLTDAGYNVPEKYITEITGIPVVKNKTPKDISDEEEIEAVNNLNHELKNQYANRK